MPVVERVSSGSDSHVGIQLPNERGLIGPFPVSNSGLEFGVVWAGRSKAELEDAETAVDLDDVTGVPA